MMRTWFVLAETLISLRSQSFPRCVHNVQSGFGPCEALAPPPRKEPRLPSALWLRKDGRGEEGCGKSGSGRKRFLSSGKCHDARVLSELGFRAQGARPGAAVQVAPNSVASNDMRLLPYSLEGTGQVRVSGSHSQGVGGLLPLQAPGSRLQAVYLLGATTRPSTPCSPLCRVTACVIVFSLVATCPC